MDEPRQKKVEIAPVEDVLALRSSLFLFVAVFVALGRLRMRRTAAPRVASAFVLAVLCAYA